jgi:hypothetical protein
LSQLSSGEASAASALLSQLSSGEAGSLSVSGFTTTSGGGGGFTTTTTTTTIGGEAASGGEAQLSTYSRTSTARSLNQFGSDTTNDDQTEIITEEYIIESNANGETTTTRTRKEIRSVSNMFDASLISSKDRVTFIKHLESQNLVESEPLILECVVSGNQTIELVWLRNGKEIPENPDFLREKVDNTYKLTVNEIFPEDSGVFSAEIFCEATNQTLLSSCSVLVRAKDEGDLDPKFIKFPSSANVEEGSSIKIECGIEGSQPLTVKWFKDNKELVETDRIKFNNDSESNTYSLEIPTTLATDDGQYSVHASNSVNEIMAAFSLTVAFDAFESSHLDVKQILEESIE